MTDRKPPSVLRRFTSLVVGVVIVVVGIYLIARPLSFDRTVLRVDGGPTFVIDIADEPSERKQGLSGRDSLGARDGMLFVFEEPGNYSFTMEGMKFPLDFIWIDENKTIVEIAADVQHTTDPSAIVDASQEFQYILEVNAGTAAEYEWEVGDGVEFSVE